MVRRVGYGAEVSGPISVNTVEVEVAPGIFKPVQFLNRPAEEVDSEAFTAADDPIDYTGADGDCGLSGGLVGGPNGQINHGQFMKSFHELVGKADRGCLNRLMAQSDLGKGDQQIRTSDVDPDFAAGDSGFIEFETFTADCERGNKEKGEDHPSQNHDRADRGKGKADRDGSPGNSGNARGRNK